MAPITRQTQNVEGKVKYSRSLERKRTFEDRLADKFKRDFGLEEVIRL